MDTIPRLETERLRLRAIFPADARGILELYADPHVARVYDFSRFEDIHAAHAWIDQTTQWFQHDIAVRWAILLKETNQLVGTCCFDTFNVNYQSCNLGYNIRSKDWGKGYATEGVRAIIDFAFQHGLVGPINRIQAITLLDNVSSKRVLEKLGFEFEGTMREYAYWDNEYHDMELFSLIRDKGERQ